MNPYKAPEADADGQFPEMAQVPGRPCLACGSSNTGRSRVFRNSPNILLFLLFGWLFLLIRGAFAKRTEICSDCGAANSFKSAGSWVAMVILMILMLIVILGLFVG